MAVHGKIMKLKEILNYGEEKKDIFFEK